MAADEMAAHLQDDDRQREHEADPEAPRHVGEFGIGRRIEARRRSGSSAMPQIGQLPGPTWRISGCIGQV